MDSDSFNYLDLIHTYIETRKSHHIHPDFKDYYGELLTHLEQLFQIDFSVSPPGRSGIAMYFRAAIDSYLSLRTPGSNFLEAGLIFKQIDALGSQGEAILPLNREIEELTQKNRELHLQFIYTLFECAYGRMCIWQA